MAQYIALDREGGYCYPVAHRTPGLESPHHEGMHMLESPITTSSIGGAP